MRDSVARMKRPALLLWLAIAGCGVEDTSPPRTRAFDIEPAVTQCGSGSAFVEGIDVSAGNGTIDWAKVKAAGRDFAFIKATQGNYDVQSTFAANWANAAAAGVQRSAYHFFDPTIDGSAQAQWFLDEIGSAGGMTSADLPPFSTSSVRRRPASRSRRAWIPTASTPATTAGSIPRR